MKLRHLAAVAACILLAACSDAPSDSRVASQIAGQFNREFGDGLIEIDHLRQAKDHQDAHGRYVADIQYDLKFTKSLKQVKQEAGPAQAMELSVIFGDFRAGDTRHLPTGWFSQKRRRGGS